MFTTHLDKLGAFGAVIATLLGLGCCLPLTPLAPLVSLLGLHVLFNTALVFYSTELLYGTVLLGLGGMALAFRRHRSPYPLLLGFVGAITLLYPFHTALDLSLFFAFIYVGLGSFLVATLWGIVLGVRCTKNCRTTHQEKFSALQQYRTTPEHWDSNMIQDWQQKG